MPFKSFGHTAELVAEARRLCAVAEVNQHCFGQLLTEQQASKAANSTLLDETRSMIMRSDGAETSFNIGHEGAQVLNKAHAAVTHADTTNGSTAALHASDQVSILSAAKDRERQPLVETHRAVTSLDATYGDAVSTDARHEKTVPLTMTNNVVTPLDTANGEEISSDARHKTVTSSSVPYGGPRVLDEAHMAVTASEIKYGEDTPRETTPEAFLPSNMAHGVAMSLNATHGAVTASNMIHGGGTLLAPIEGEATSLNAAHGADTTNGEPAPLDVAHEAVTLSHLTREEATALMTMPPTMAEVEFFLSSSRSSSSVLLSSLSSPNLHHPSALFHHHAATFPIVTLRSARVLNLTPASATTWNQSLNIAGRPGA